MEELETPPPTTTPEPESEPGPETAPPQTVSIEEWMASSEPGIEEAPQPESLADAQLLAVLEACVYVAEEPLMPDQIAAALNQEPERIRALLEQLVVEFDRPEHGVSIREVAGGYKMATKPEHHEAVRNFVKSLKAPLKLSLPALETLAVIAYKQPVTTPEIMEIRGVQGGGVLKTLLDRKLITEAGRKNVIGKPILYKTTKEFLIQFGLKDLSELPSLKEFEEIRRMSMADSEIPPEAPDALQAELQLESTGPVLEAGRLSAETEGSDVPALDSAAVGSDTEALAPSPRAAVPDAEASFEAVGSDAPAPGAADAGTETEAASGSDAEALDAAAAGSETETVAPSPRTAVPDAEGSFEAAGSDASAPGAVAAGTETEPEASEPQSVPSDAEAPAPEALAAGSDIETGVPAPHSASSPGAVPATNAEALGSNVPAQDPAVSDDEAEEVSNPSSESQDH
jgi:segregation and condensation protein B